MWKCVKCHEVVGDELEVCWNCGTTEDGVEDPHFQHAEDIRPEDLTSPGIPPPPFDESDSPGAATPPAAFDQSTAIQEAAGTSRDRIESAKKKSLPCPRCDRAMAFVGTKSFHEGFAWGIFGDLGEAFVNHENFDLYICRRCGRVEFFVSGIGEEFRPRKTSD